MHVEISMGHQARSLRIKRGKSCPKTKVTLILLGLEVSDIFYFAQISSIKHT